MPIYLPGVFYPPSMTRSVVSEACRQLLCSLHQTTRFPEKEFGSAKGETHDRDFNEDIILEDRGIGEQKRSGDANADAPQCERTVPGSNSLSAAHKFPPTHFKPKESV